MDIFWSLMATSLSSSLCTDRQTDRQTGRQADRRSLAFFWGLSLHVAAKWCSRIPWKRIIELMSTSSVRLLCESVFIDCLINLSLDSHPQGHEGEHRAEHSPTLQRLSLWNDFTRNGWTITELRFLFGFTTSTGFLGGFALPYSSFS